MKSIAISLSGARKPGSARSHSGFTLVELMISMVIGLFIVLALVTLLINVNRNNSELSKTNRVIENGRFAMQLLQADVIHAGYWGGYVPAFDDLTNNAIPVDVPAAVVDPCLDLTSWDAAYKNSLIGIGVQGYEIPAVVPSPTLSACATRVVNPKAKTDVLVVRHAETCVAGVAGCAAPVASDVYMQVARCTTTTSPNYSASSHVLGTDTFTLRNRDCTTVAPQHKFVSNLYYIRTYSVTVGDGIPTLMRSQFTGTAHGAAEALIEGIEGFRVEFGVDSLSDTGANVNFAQARAWANPTNLTSPINRGDGSPDGAYIRCTTAAPCTPGQLMNAVAVKAYVLARSERPSSGYQDSKVYCLGSSCPAATVTDCVTAGTNPAPLLGPFCDGFKRHLFSQTIRIVNVASRRETP